MSTLISLEQLNALSESDAQAWFKDCCNSTRWWQAMTALRPFTSKESLIAIADDVWKAAKNEDVLEAFEGHARIGDLSALKK